ncbi:MAG: plastocyanin/azurin family copper-binding protein [Thermodesulfobacteriota bacterium]
MNPKRLVFLLILAALFATSGAGYGVASEITERFEEALSAQSSDMMDHVVRINIEKVPGEIDALIEEALLPETTEEKRESNFYVAESMAMEYKKITRDTSPLKEVKKKIFESRLSPPVRTAPLNGVHTVEALSTEKVKNIFRPDNVTVKTGETVRWINNDTETHLLSSILSFVGRGGLFSPKIEPGQAWEYTFEKPGDYYYICFIHKVMYGKVTVEE